jgi:hypothetical protein
MYAVYNYKAGSTQAQVLSDIISILTGTTNVASLSASCVQSNTSITSTVAAGWSVWDASAGTNWQMLRTLAQDGVTYKYWGIQLNGISTFLCFIAETWNASTHAGTNACTTGSGSWDATNGGYFYIYATAKNIIMISWTTTGSFRGFTGSTIETTRDAAIPSGYPCYAMFSQAAGQSAPWFSLANTSSWFISRAKNQTSSGDTTVSAAITNLGPILNVGGPQGAGSGLYRDASENQYIALYSAGMSFNSVFAGTAYDIKLSSVSSATLLDEFSYSGTNYVNFGFGATASGGGLWVPKQ